MTGRVAIETLCEGDMVIARKEETGVSGIFPVSAVMKGESRALRWLTLADANGETSRLGLTGGHPMFVVGAGWVHADEVVEGDRIRNVDLQELTVLSVEVDTRPQIVHNLEIADAHTYFAGEFEAWGHNNKWRKHRGKVFDDCGGKCASCGKKTEKSGPRKGSRKDRFSLNHIIPRKWARWTNFINPPGDGDISNLEGLCCSCNSRLGANMRAANTNGPPSGQ